ncbi:nitrite reductase small subunit NirD [Paenibacillus alkalitolerans]|uniref:nitrite reductase small subunit NirD n=1 Tax=Paenibacillus alkalitolerans TaxID=2799335 RepID=UPI0018F2AA6A|nr:nitrite reductase small subunit NirD [Paenibacillus alkalitolerans]
MNTRYESAAAETLELAKLDDLPVGMGKTVRVRELELAVFRLADGTVRVIENRCPHKNGVLAEGLVSGSFVFCPLHDRKISLDDGMVQKPDTGCVRTFPISIRDGAVWLEWD